MHVIFWILNFGCIVPTLYFLLHFGKLKRHAPSWYLVFSFVIASIQLVTGKFFGLRNWWTIVVFCIGAILIVTFMNRQLAHGKLLRKTLSYLGFGLFTLMILVYLTVVDWQYSRFPAMMACDIYSIVSSIWIFFDLALNSKKDNLLDEPAYWYYSGLLVFSSVVLFRNIHDGAIFESYYLLQSITYALMCITFTVGLYKWKNQLQSST